MSNTRKTTGAAAKALKEEAEELKVYSFEYDGDKYVFDKSTVDDVEVYEAMEDGKMAVPLRTILGAEQWAKFKSKKRTVEELGRMLEAMYASIGVDSGESAG